MATSVVRPEDLDWAVQVFRQRREALVGFAPVFWRAAPNASARHRAFLERLLSEGGGKGFRTDSSILIAAPEGEGWLVDDAHVQGPVWARGDGRCLWNALDGEVHGARVRFVCPTYEQDRAEFARTVGLALADSWWLRESPSASGGEAGVRVALAGGQAVTVAAPPVYDPLGPVLFLPGPSDARVALPAAVVAAGRLGCPAIVVNQVAGDDALAQELSTAGFRRHCDYYAGAIAPI
jgi:hypothetical protein